MSSLLAARVSGIPGPKGSLVGYCNRCRRGVPLREQSQVGVKFRKVIARSLKGALAASYAGPVETRATFYVVQEHSAGGALWPSHDLPYPTHHNSGDVEKHGRTVHDALMDAGIIADDSQVWRTVLEKRWATPEHPSGVELQVRTA